MNYLDFLATIAKSTGKYVSIPRARKLLRNYSPDLVQEGLDALLAHKTPYLIPDPLSYIQRIISVKLNKQEAQDILNTIIGNS